MDKTDLREKAMKNAIASVRMEGLTVTDEMVELCRQFLNGERTKKECLDHFRKKAVNGGK